MLISFDGCCLYFWAGEFLQRLYQPILVWSEICGFWLTLVDFRSFGAKKFVSVQGVFIEGLSD